MYAQLEAVRGRNAGRFVQLDAEDEIAFCSRIVTACDTGLHVEGPQSFAVATTYPEATLNCFTAPWTISSTMTLAGRISCTIAATCISHQLHPTALARIDAPDP